MEQLDLSGETQEALANRYLLCAERIDKHNKDIAKVENVKKQVVTALLAKMKETGEVKFSVEGATVSRSTRTYVSCGGDSWAVFYKFLFDKAVSLQQTGQDPTQAFSFLQKRVMSETVMSYMEANGGTPPPAINVSSEYAISVRRTKKKEK